MERRGMLVIAIFVHKFISTRYLFCIDLYVLKFVLLWLCAEQGKDLDDIFRSTAGMIFRTVFYSCDNLHFFNDLTTSKDKLLTYTHYEKPVVKISTTFLLIIHIHVLVFCAYQLLIQSMVIAAVYPPQCINSLFEYFLIGQVYTRYL